MILAEVLELTAPFEEFQSRCVRASAAGTRGNSGTQLDTDQLQSGFPHGRDRVDYTELLRHIEMITAWDEFHRFAAMVKLIGIRVYGKLNAQAERWLTRGSVASQVFPNLVSVFIRPVPAKEDN